MTPPRKGFRECAKCGKNRSEKFYTSSRGRVCSSCRKESRRQAARNARIRATYGLSAEDYDRIFEAQNGRCAICRETRKNNLAVDHCHKTEAIRGLLCARCNGQLLARGARDRPEVLRRAAEYLENYPAWEVLGPRYTYDMRTENG
ncbi:endonuclease VII domain-containing protein [Streptomyces antarcticus]|uniref:endonuclease VII domain-containing protein n=1 Tax=Streptomyces antarcticus TaxID=2996458 RepID=UPI002271C836|nr:MULTISPECIES: endonuclease VII domain-containing protein [unclassified Streptomyces]MCY0941895.1 endonuclease VII domain-containing protein [Streptomyces sp. H34-AA3]MCZ4082832.1 endonuclease VII domain-containing protein [Streptomyces sp. H34-S5]